MKKSFLVLIIAGLVLTGFTKHYYNVNKDVARFYLEKPESKQVFFLSSLDGYRPHKAREISANTWQVKVPAHAEFKYVYNVDGNIYVPPCKLKENDNFGSQNCIYIPGM